MDAEQRELLQTSPLIQRLDRRRTHSIGVIDLHRYNSESSRLPNWLVQRSTLVEQLQSRYSSRDRAAEGTELPLAIAFPAPVAERVSYAPEAPSAGAIAPSTPVEMSPPSPPVRVSQTAPAASSVEKPDWSTPVPPPETIASSSESAIQPTAAPPTEQYHIRRVSANPATQPAAIQRKAASDESSAVIVSSSTVSPVQPSQSAAVLIAPESPTNSVTLDDRPHPIANPAPLGFVTQAAALAPISAIPSQSGESATEATWILRHALPAQPDAPHVKSTVALAPETAIAPTQQTRVEGLVARPLVPSASMPAIMQRSVNPVDSQPTVTEFSTQPAALAPALSISELPLQPSLIWRSADAAADGVLQRRSQPDLPLAVSSVQVVQPRIARQTETSTAATITAATPSSSDVPPPAPPPTPTSDSNVGQIAEQVSRILFRQLTVERERRGIGKWS